jgi:predicted DNA-binding ribbon-helix-helix protein
LEERANGVTTRSRHTEIGDMRASRLKSAVIKHSVIIGSHRTSISLEDPFWRHLKEIARADGWPVSKLIAEIDGSRQYGNLSSAIRLFVLEHFRAKSNFAQPLDSRQTESQMVD